MVWSQDADGYINFSRYDSATGAVIQQIQDVNVADVSQSNGYTQTEVNLEANLTGTIPANAGENLITTYVVDSQGRTIWEKDPDGDITCTVYNDADQEVLTYPGWQDVSGTCQTTGPVQLSRTDLTGTYTETMTYGWTGTGNNALQTTTLTVNGVPYTIPLGNESPGSQYAVIQSLSRSLINTNGQVYETLDYTSEPSSGYAIAPAAIGSPGTNYLETQYFCDSSGRNISTISPDGTVDDTIYDGFGEVVEEWKGTNDDGVTGFDTWVANNPSAVVNTASGAHMYEVSSSAYNVNGDVIESDQYVNPTGDTNPWKTYYVYDWQDRQYMTVNPPNDVLNPTTGQYDVTYTMTTLDNLGEATETQQILYTGSNLTNDIQHSQGNNPPAQLNQSNTDVLLSESTSAFDTLGQVYESRGYSVAGPEALTTITFNGTVATATAATNQELGVGDVIEISGASQQQYNGQFTITSVSGNTFSYTMSGTAGQINGQPVATATCVQPSTYLPTDTWYDPDGNVLATRTGVGPIEKSVYNGSGEVIATYTVATSTATASLFSNGNWNQAMYLQSSDTVVEQTQTWYDADGNTVVSADYQQFPGDTQSGPLTALDSYVTATASFYDAAGRDVEDVNYGRQDLSFGNPDMSQSGEV